MSKLPEAERLLVESFPHDGREYTCVYGFAGRNAMQTLGRKGVRFVDDAPIRLRMDGIVDYAGRVFSDEIQFAFSHPASVLGILFEFIQYPDAYQTP